MLVYSKLRKWVYSVNLELAGTSKLISLPLEISGGETRAYNTWLLQERPEKTVRLLMDFLEKASLKEKTPRP